MKKKTILSCILMLVFAVCLKIIPVCAFDFPIYEETFEGSSNWSADNGVWEIGVPTSGPGAAHEGMKCAGTILSANYPGYTDSRLIGPYISPWEQGIELRELTGNEELHLRFWNWFNYSSYDSGQVQISVQDDATGEWGAWVNEGGAVSSYSGGWSLKDVDLTDYAGQTIRIGFLHVADRNQYGHASEGPGWFIDDIQIIKKVPEFTGDFEMGWVDWSASTGVWQIGDPASGPGECYEGDQCAGTVLDGNYPAYTDSRLVGATIDLSGCSAFVVYLSFWEWFSYSSYDYGTVQISDWDSETEQWSGWVSLIQSTGTSTVWTHKYVDLTNYAGKIFRIGFLHVANRNQYGHASESHGWFIDNLELVGPTQIMPTINAISFTAYIPDCTSLIDVFASDPCGGELTFTWQLPDGGTLVGTGANMEFIPPEIRVEPYRVRVAACSKATHICSFTRTLKIFTEVLYDLDGDDDIDGSDLAEFLVSGEVNATTISRFAEEFGMIACEQ